MWLLVKSTNLQYLSLEAKMEQSKTTLFSQTFKVAEAKVPLFFSFLASRLRYWWLVLFTRILICLTSTECEVPVPIFKVNDQNPSDKLRFWGVTKENHKKHLIPLNSTDQFWQMYNPNKTWYRPFEQNSTQNRYKTRSIEFKVTWRISSTSILLHDYFMPNSRQI